MPVADPHKRSSAADERDDHDLVNVLAGIDERAGGGVATGGEVGLVRSPPQGARRVSGGPARGAGVHHGSRGSSPDTCCSARRRSATRRAIGPDTAISWRVVGKSSGVHAVASGTRPSVGRMAQMPQNWARDTQSRNRYPLPRGGGFAVRRSGFAAARAVR
jgi:hypothetical protein